MPCRFPAVGRFWAGSRLESELGRASFSNTKQIRAVCQGSAPRARCDRKAGRHNMDRAASASRAAAARPWPAACSRRRIRTPGRRGSFGKRKATHPAKTAAEASIATKANRPCRRRELTVSRQQPAAGTSTIEGKNWPAAREVIDKRARRVEPEPPTVAWCTALGTCHRIFVYPPGALLRTGPW
jgi:hypothetical protein